MSDIVDILWEGQADTRLAAIASEIHDLRAAIEELTEVLSHVLTAVREVQR